MLRVYGVDPALTREMLVALSTLLPCPALLTVKFFGGGLEGRGNVSYFMNAAGLEPS